MSKPIGNRFYAVTIVTSVLVAAGYWYLQAPRWRTYESPDGKFRIDFPTTPSTQEWPNNEVGTTHVVVAKPTLRVVYACDWSEVRNFNGLPPDEFIKRSQDFGIQGVQGVLLSGKKITVGGYPGREFQVQTRNNGAMDNRIILVGNRIYSLSVINTEGKHESDNIRRFFDSFQLE